MNTILGISKEIFLHFIHILRYWFQNKDSKRMNIMVNGARGPVLVICGFGGGGPRATFKKYFQKNNIHGVVPYIGYQLDSIDSQVLKIEAVLKKTKLHRPTIIGFSNGGIVAVRLAQKIGWEKVEKIISINTPFQGSYAGLLGLWSAAAREVLPTSKLLQDINSKNIPKDTVVCVYGDWDEYVDPNNSKLKNCVAEHVPSFGHESIMKEVPCVIDRYIINTL